MSPSLQPLPSFVTSKVFAESYASRLSACANGAVHSWSAIHSCPSRWLVGRRRPRARLNQLATSRALVQLTVARFVVVSLFLFFFFQVTSSNTAASLCRRASTPSTWRSSALPVRCASENERQSSAGRPVFHQLFKFIIHLFCLARSYAAAQLGRAAGHGRPASGAPLENNRPSAKFATPQSPEAPFTARFRFAAGALPAVALSGACGHSLLHSFPLYFSTPNI